MINRLSNFFVEFPSKLANFIAILPRGLGGGTVVAVSWVVIIIYRAFQSIFKIILRIFPGDSAKPLYKIGENIADATVHAAKPLHPTLKSIEDLKASTFYRFWAVNLIALSVVIGIIIYITIQAVGIVQDTNFGVLTQPFNASAGAGFLAVAGQDAIWVAILKGLVNTLVLVIIAIALSSLIGLLVGIARLAKHPLISRFATGYTELFRNVPLLALMLLIFALVLQLLPRIENAWSIPRVIYFSNRGIAIPSTAIGSDLWWIWGICLIIGLVGALLLRRQLILKEQNTGKIYRPNLYGILTFSVVAVGSYLLLFLAFGFDVPVSISLPDIDDSGISLRYLGGFSLSTAFLAALLGLIFYFSAFIAEIVRGSIQAVPHGQIEAANSLGLSAYQRFTLVVLPQALTIMIPSLNNEYQNVNKDSAVAFGIGYIELLFVLRQVANERGELVTILIAALFVYMFVNLIISGIMNTINRLNQVAR